MPKQRKGQGSGQQSEERQREAVAGRAARPMGPAGELALPLFLAFHSQRNVC